MKYSYSLIKKILPKAPPAKKLAEKLNFYSFEVEEVKGDTLDIKLPANIYSYAAGHISIARELAAILNLKFVSPVKAIINPPEKRGRVKVKIQNPEGCFRYAARVFELPSTGSGDKVRQSSAEIKKILKSCGINAINQVVDITNIVMLETGQPLHAFDADKLIANRPPDSRASKSQIELTVRFAHAGEEFETLDNKKFVLDTKTLVIADSKKALALAGIKGGKNSGVTSTTRRIILEAAKFEPSGIYQTSRRFKIITDGSVRHSHGLSPALVDHGMDRATELLKKMGAKLVDSVDVYPKKAGDEVISFNPQQYEKLIGAPVLVTDAKRIFEALGFGVETKMKKGEGILRVRIPAWRNDIQSFEDLAEEVARMRGYTELEKRAPVVSLKTATQEDHIILKDNARHILVRLQFDEVYNYSFVGEEEVEGAPLPSLFGRVAKPVELENPIAEDRKYLRTGLSAQLTKNIQSNARYFDAVRIFELGKIFANQPRIVNAKVREKIRDNSNNKLEIDLRERIVLGIAIGSKKGSGLIREMKGAVDELLKSVGLAEFHLKPEGNFLRIESENRIIGQIGTASLTKGWSAVYAEVDMEHVLTLVKSAREFKPLPKYPSIMRDLSLLVARDIRIGDLMSVMQNAASDILYDIDLIDEYERGEAAKQSLTFRFVFQSETRTLLDEEVNREMEKITNTAKIKFSAQVR